MPAEQRADKYCTDSMAIFCVRQHNETAGSLTRRNAVKQIHPDRYEVALEAALRHLELETAISTLLCGALERIVDGTYGRCLKCSATIAQERLRALPWARLCAECQDASDQNNEPDPSSAPGCFRNETGPPIFGDFREPPE
jgi:RNA polymerase-binding transcription factor DksA